MGLSLEQVLMPLKEFLTEYLTELAMSARKLSLRIGANLWPNDERGVILTWSLNENFGSLLILKLLIETTNVYV